MAKKYICSQCDKEFATRQSLWKHKQKRRCSQQSARTSSQPPPTFIGAAIEDSPLERRAKNPRIQALIDEIVNDDDDSKRHVQTPQVIHQGFSILHQTTSTIPSRSSKSSIQLAPSSQSTLTTREKPGMKTSEQFEIFEIF